MYAEAPVHDEEVLSQSGSSRSSARRHAALILMAMALVAVAFRGLVSPGESPSTARVGEQLVLDLEEDAEVQLQLSITGIQYQDWGTGDWAGNQPTTAACKLDPELTPRLNTAAANQIDNNKPKETFKYAVRTAVANKAKVPATAVEFKEEPLSNAAFPRTTGVVTITVPSALTTSAVLSRLNDGSTLLWDIKDILTACNIKHTGSIMPHAVMTSKAGESTVMETKSNPSISVEMEVKGIYYKRLIGTDLRKAFADSLRASLATEGVEAESIGLNIQDGAMDANDVPVVIVSATIPVPAGLTADATMSKWPGGREGMGKTATQNIKAISNIDQTRKKDGAQGFHDILVMAGPLRLGGIRMSYRRQVQVVLQVSHMELDPARAKFTTLSSISDKVKESLVAQVDKDDDVEVEFLKTDANGNEEVADITADAADLQADEPLLVRASVSQHHGASTAADAVVWETKLIPAVRTIETYFKQHGVADAGQTIAFTMRVPKLSNSADTFDMDLVVHGVDFNALRPESKGAFLDDIAKAVRQGLVTAVGGAHITKVQSQVSVAVSSQDSTGAVNVKVGIPAPDDAEQQVLFHGSLDSKTTDGTLQTELETQLRAMPGIAYVSTWTPKAISVSVPSSINDYSGDVVGSGDEV